MRRGSFGRTSRQGSPNLTALIASLMREQRAAEDHAIFDAYQNGGLFKGKPVDDKAILGYITSRRNGFDKSDPLYDEWNNKLIQTTFSIGEQKIGLAFKQGKASAGAVAAWYRGQLSKIPKDSAFYRDVAGRAADWAKSAAGAARGRARSGVTSALNAKIAKLGETTASYEALTNGLEDIARRAGFIAGNQTLSDATAEHLQQLFGMGITFQGKPVTLESWQRAAQARYAVFDATIKAYQQAGRKVPKSLLTAKGKFLDQTLVRLNAVDDRAKYELARAHFNDVVTAAQNDPNAVLTATQDYINTLTNIREGALAATGANTNDPEFIGGLQNEITSLVTGKASGPTVTDLQHTTGEGVVTTDAEKLAKASAAYQQEYSDLHAGLAYYGQGVGGANPDELKVRPYPKGGEYDPTGHHGLGEALQTVLTTVDGHTEAVVLAGTAVYGRAVQGKTAVEGDTPLGYVYTNPLDGQTSYGVKLQDGSLVFTYQNPFTDLVRDDKGNLVVDTTQFTVDAKNKPIFQPGAGLVPGINPATFAPVLVDGSVSPADIGKFYDGTDPTIAAFLAQRAKDAAATGAAAAARTQTAENRDSVHGPSYVPDIAANPMDRSMSQLSAANLEQIGANLRQVLNAANPPPMPPTNIGRPPPTPPMPPINASPATPPSSTPPPPPIPPPVVTSATSAAAAGIGSAAGAAAAAAAAAAMKPPPPTSPTSTGRIGGK